MFSCLFISNVTFYLSMIIFFKLLYSLKYSGSILIIHPLFVEWGLTDQYGESLCGVLANVLDCDILVSEFELPSRYYVHFQINTLGKDMNPHM